MAKPKRGKELHKDVRIISIDPERIPADCDPRTRIALFEAIIDEYDVAEEGTIVLSHTTSTRKREPASPLAALPAEAMSPNDAPDHIKMVSWCKLAWTIAERYRHAFCKNHVFSRSMRDEVYEHILSFGVTKMKEKFDPDYGVLETTYLYEIMVRMAKAEYCRMIAERNDRKMSGCLEVVTDPFELEENSQRPCKNLAGVEREELFTIYSTVSEDEMQEIKPQYLPQSLRDLPVKALQEKLSAIDRTIVDRLSQGEELSDVRKDFEKSESQDGKKVDHRQFFENRRSAIIRRGKLQEPKSWGDNIPFTILQLTEDDEFGEEFVIWPAEERERRQRRRQKRREAQKARRTQKSLEN